jgi:hypothetical protein
MEEIKTTEVGPYLTSSMVPKLLWAVVQLSGVAKE